MTKTGRLTHAAIATVLLCMATVAYMVHMAEFGRFFAGTYDFLPRYTQARMVGSPKMYDIEAGYREQDRVVGLHEAGVYHDRLPWQALLMAPLGWLPYLWAYWIWIALDLVCFAALTCLWLLPRNCVLWGATFLPVAICVIMGQDTILIALCLAGVFRLADKRRDLAAGLLLALCSAKPHLFVLVPLALIAHRRWRMVRGAALGTLGLLAVGTAAAGWDWPVRLWAILKTLSRDSDLGHDVARRPSLFQFGMNEWTIGLAFVLAVGFGYLIWRTRSLEAGVGTAVLGSLLIAPHTAIYDLPILLLALPTLPLRSYGHWLRIALFTPIPYCMLQNGAPWSAVLPVMLLAVVVASAWPLFNKDRRALPRLGERPIEYRIPTQ